MQLGRRECHCFLASDRQTEIGGVGRSIGTSPKSGQVYNYQCHIISTKQGAE